MPDGWDTLGLFGVFRQDAAQWHYPNRPGATHDTWVDAVELPHRPQPGGAPDHVEILEGIAFDRGRPLDNFAARIMKARENAAELDADPHLVEAVESALRAILLQTIGGFHSEGRDRTMVVESTFDVPPQHQGTIRTYGDVVTYLIPAQLNERLQHVPPPGVLLADLGAGTGPDPARPDRPLPARRTEWKEWGALEVDPSQLIGVNGDALYLTRCRRPAYRSTQGGGDDGKAGRLRVKGWIGEPMPVPATTEARNTLRGRAESLRSPADAGVPRHDPTATHRAAEPAQQLILALRAAGRCPMQEIWRLNAIGTPRCCTRWRPGNGPGTNLLPDADRPCPHRPCRTPARTPDDPIGSPARIRGRRGEAGARTAAAHADRTDARASSVCRPTIWPAAPGRSGSPPRSRRASVGRFDAKQATMDAIAEAAREQRRVAFVVHYADGSSHTLGSKWGYRANDAYVRAQGEWQDAFEWLGQEASAVANRLYNLQALNIPIVGVDVTAFGVPDPNQPVPPSARPAGELPRRPPRRRHRARRDAELTDWTEVSCRISSVRVRQRRTQDRVMGETEPVRLFNGWTVKITSAYVVLPIVLDTMSTGHPCEGQIHADIHLEKADGQPFTVSDPDTVLYPVRVTEIFAKVVGTGWSTKPGDHRAVGYFVHNRRRATMTQLGESEAFAAETAPMMGEAVAVVRDQVKHKITVRRTSRD